MHGVRLDSTRATCHTFRVEQSENFWMTIATIVPVFGLALLLVARAQFRESVGSRWNMAWLGITFVPPLLGAPFVEMVALAALLGERVSDWWASLAMLVVLLAAVSLFISPALNILFAVFPGLVGAGSAVIRRNRRIVRSARRTMLQQRSSLDRIFRIETGRLDEISSAVWRAVERDGASSLAVERLRSRYVGEVRQLELAAQELEFSYRRSQAIYRQASANYDGLVAASRRATVLISWGLFSSTIGQEGLDQAREEARIAIDELVVPGEGPEGTRWRVWGNEQVVARWPAVAAGPGAHPSAEAPV